MWIYLPLGPVQTLLHSCAEPNWWFKYGKRAASESIWYGESVCCGKRSTESVELLSNGVPSDLDVAQESLQSRTYSVRSSTWKVKGVWTRPYILNYCILDSNLYRGVWIYKKYLQVNRYQPKITWQYSFSSSSSQFLSKFIFRVVLFIWSFAAIFSVLVWLLIDDLP